MLADGSHVSIDGIPFVLSFDDQGMLQYQDSFQSLFANTSAIAGEIAKEQLRPEKLLWSLTDFITGEGATIYYPNNSTQYDIAHLMNVTKRGQLTTRTKRRRTSLARAGANADAAKRPVGGSAYTHALIAWEDNLIRSSDAITWTAAQDTSPAMTTANYSDAVMDGTNIAFLAYFNGVTDVIPVVTADSSTTTWADTETGVTVQSAVGADSGAMGAVLDGVPYTWSENSVASVTLCLYKKTVGMATAADWGATLIFNSGITPVGTWGTNFWTDAEATENAIFLSYSTKTHAFVWEVRNDVARPFYTGPSGFALKKLLYQSGILFMIGNSAAAGSTFAEIKAIPLTTGQVIDGVAQPRRHQNTSISTFDVGCADNTGGIFVADRSSGKIFYYDIRNDALSLFDDLVNGGTGDGVDFVSGEDNIAFLAMHGARLFTATYNTADTGVTSLQIISWDDLEVQNRDSSQAISANLESAAWDFGLPMETKALIGFYVTYKVTDSGTTSGLLANTRITISYSMDDASYSTTGAASTTITSATTPVGAKGRHFIQISDGTTTQKFTRLKVKITLDNNSTAVAPPILFGVTAEAVPMAYARTWDMILRVEDEEQNERPGSRQNTGEYIRNQIITIARNKDIVPFVDGTASRQPNVTSTFTVTVEDPSFSLGDSIGNGRMQVRLREVIPSA